MRNSDGLLLLGLGALVYFGMKSPQASAAESGGYNTPQATYTPPGGAPKQTVSLPTPQAGVNLINKAGREGGTIDTGDVVLQKPTLSNNRTGVYQLKSTGKVIAVQVNRVATDASGKTATDRLIEKNKALSKSKLNQYR